MGSHTQLIPQLLSRPALLTGVLPLLHDRARPELLFEFAQMLMDRLTDVGGLRPPGASRQGNAPYSHRESSGRSADRRAVADAVPVADPHQ